MGHAPYRLTRIGQSQLGPIIKINTWDRGKVLTAYTGGKKNMGKEQFVIILGVVSVANPMRNVS
jgi:hypothetical protein